MVPEMGKAPTQWCFLGMLHIDSYWWNGSTQSVAIDIALDVDIKALRNMFGKVCSALTELVSGTLLIWRRFNIFQHPTRSTISGLPRCPRSVPPTKWRFPERGVPPLIIHFTGTFPYKPTILDTHFWNPQMPMVVSPVVPYQLHLQFQLLTMFTASPHGIGWFGYWKWWLRKKSQWFSVDSRLWLVVTGCHQFWIFPLILGC